MTTYGYVGWAALLLIIAVLRWIARGFTRTTFRLAVLLAVAVCAIAITFYGLVQGGGAPSSFKAAFDRGGGDLEQRMLGPLLPDGHHVLPGLPGWIALLVALGAVLAYFDTVCTRREQPRVQVAHTPAISDAPARARTGPVSRDRVGVRVAEGQAAVTERLQFQLPAVEVRKPAIMPGGSTLENLAAVASESGIQGSKLTAALMRAIHALEARIPAYEARLLVETCNAAGEAEGDGHRLRVTVDLRDIRSGQCVAVRVLPPCIPAEAAERAAGFTARQVFCHDPATPAWAVGSANGEDLSAYLLARQKSPRSQTFRACYECRQRQRKLLHGAVARSPTPEWSSTTWPAFATSTVTTWSRSCSTSTTACIIRDSFEAGTAWRCRWACCQPRTGSTVSGAARSAGPALTRLRPVRAATGRP